MVMVLSEKSYIWCRRRHTPRILYFLRWFC